MDIKLLQTFIEVIAQGSITQAGRALCLTQSAVSKRMAKLEAELGHPLFSYDSKQLKPNKNADMLYPYALDLVQAHKNMQDALANSFDRPQRLHIGTTLFTTNNYLVPLIQYLDGLQLPFEVNYQQIADKQIKDYLNSGQLDLILGVRMAQDEEEIRSIPLWNERFHCIVNADHPLAALKEVSLKALFDYPAVLTEIGYPIRDKIEALSKTLNLRPNIKITSSAFLVLQQLVREGKGWTILPEPLCSPDLVQLNCPDLFSSLPVCLYLHRDRAVSQSVTLLCEQLARWDLKSN